MLQREIIRKVRRLELVTRRKASNRLAGEYHSVFKGRGMDFDEVQPYAPGDDVRFIDWNVSARTGELFIKRFVEERELTVLVVVDSSASLRFGTTSESKADVVAELAAVLAFSATRNNDRVGLVIFSEEVEQYIPPKKGRKHVLRIIRDILDKSGRGRGTDLSAALDFVARVSRRKAVVFVISDFLDGDYERALKLAARRHDVVPLIIEDPFEVALPRTGGLLPIRDLETGAQSWLDLGSKRQVRSYNERIERARHERDLRFRRLRLDTVTVDTQQPYLDRLVAFFRRRASRY